MGSLNTNRFSKSPDKRTLFLILIMIIATLRLPDWSIPAKGIDGEGWLTGWDYRRGYMINSASGAGTNYQVKLSVGYDSTSELFQPLRYDSNPFTPPGDGLGYGVTHPSVLYFPDSEDGYKFWMFYEYGVDAGDPTKSVINLIRSNDGVTWVDTGISNPVFSNDTHGTHDPTIIKQGATWYLWFQTKPDNDIGHATSPDGENWTLVDWDVLENGASGFDDFDVLSPSVIYEDGTYFMWYTGLNESSGYARLGLATSPDGTTWTKDDGNPILNGTSGEWDAQVIWHISVTEYQGRYILWYSGDDGYAGAGMDFGIALSENKTGWVKGSNNPIMSPIGAGWEDTRMYTPRLLKYANGSAVILDGSMYLYYSATTTGPNMHSIGLAIIPNMDGVIDLGGDCETDFGDIRFTSSDGETEIDYWIEEQVNGSHAVIWVEVSENLHTANRRIYLYYGNIGEGTTMSGEDTFLLFDDFPGGAIDAGKWTTEVRGDDSSVIVTGGEVELRVADDQTSSASIKSVSTFTNTIAVRVRRKNPTDDEYLDFTLASGDIEDKDGGTANWYMTTAKSGYYWDYGRGDVLDNNEIWEMPPAGGRTGLSNDDVGLGGLVNFYSVWEYHYRSDGTLEWFVNDVLKASTSDNTFLGDAKFLLITQGAFSGAGRGAPTFVDWALVRKSISPEPIGRSWGPVEPGPAVPPAGASNAVLGAYSIDGWDGIALYTDRGQDSAVFTLRAEDPDGADTITLFEFRFLVGGSVVHGFEYDKSEEGEMPSWSPWTKTDGSTWQVHSSYWPLGNDGEGDARIDGTSWEVDILLTIFSDTYRSTNIQMYGRVTSGGERTDWTLLEGPVWHILDDETEDDATTSGDRGGDTSTGDDDDDVDDIYIEPTEPAGDIDGDGIPDDEDDDIDGDGIPNDRDSDMDGDGLSNRDDDDIDGDGIPNGNDWGPYDPSDRRSGAQTYGIQIGRSVYAVESIWIRQNGASVIILLLVLAFLMWTQDDETKETKLAPKQRKRANGKSLLETLGK